MGIGNKKTTKIKSTINSVFCDVIPSWIELEIGLLLEKELANKALNNLSIIRNLPRKEIINPIYISDNKILN